MSRLRPPPYGFCTEDNDTKTIRRILSRAGSPAAPAEEMNGPGYRPILLLPPAVKLGNRVRHVASRAIVMQKKTQRPVQFEVPEQTRDALSAWIATAHLRPEQFLFPSRVSESPHLSPRQYSRIVASWVASISNASTTARERITGLPLARFRVRRSPVSFRYAARAA